MIQRSSRPYSYYRYWTGTSMQCRRLNRGISLNRNKFFMHLKRLPASASASPKSRIPICYPIKNRESSKSKKGRGALDEPFLDCSLHAETKTQDLSDICVNLRFTVVPRYWPLLRWLVCARHSCLRGFPSNRRALVRELLARWTGETGNRSPPCI